MILEFWLVSLSATKAPNNHSVAHGPVAFSWITNTTWTIQPSVFTEFLRRATSFLHPILKSRVYIGACMAWEDICVSSSFESDTLSATSTRTYPSNVGSRGSQGPSVINMNVIYTLVLLGFFPLSIVMVQMLDRLRRRK